MQTSSSRARPGLVVAIACASLCAFALVLRPPSPPSALFNRFAAQTSGDAADMPGMTCKQAGGPLVGGINSAVQWAVGQIPLRPHVSQLPVEAKLRVGLYTTRISNISLKAVTVDDVAMRECKRPRDIFKNVPRVLPDVIMVMVTGIRVNIGLNFDSNGLCGLWCARVAPMAHARRRAAPPLDFLSPRRWPRCVGGVAGAATSLVVGAINLTVSYQRADLTEVTECDGDFKVEEAVMVGARAGAKELPSISGLPIGRILCYGTKPKGLLMSVATSVELIDTQTGQVIDSSKPFPGLVALLNAKFASVCGGHGTAGGPPVWELTWARRQGERQGGGALTPHARPAGSHAIVHTPALPPLPEAGRARRPAPRTCPRRIASLSVPQGCSTTSTFLPPAHR